MSSQLPLPEEGCTLRDAAWHPDPYPFYARLRARHRDAGLFFDPALGLWVACTAAAVQAALASPALCVRPPQETVPRPLQGRPSGEVFGGLMRMNEGKRRHDEPRAWAQALLAQLPARVASVTPPGFSPAQVNEAIVDAPLAVLAALLGLPPELWVQNAHEVRRLVAGWAAGADEATIADADAAATSLLNRFDGDANRIGLFTQTCDATAGLVGAGLVAWQRDPGARLDADGLASVALRDPPVQNTRRFVAEPVALCGQALQRGDAVLVLLASANQDEAAQHGWGRGRHACPGERLSQEIAARVIAQGLAQDREGWRAASSRWRYRPLPNVRIPVFG